MYSFLLLRGTGQGPFGCNPIWLPTAYPRYRTCAKLNSGCWLYGFLLRRGKSRKHFRKRLGFCKSNRLCSYKKHNDSVSSKSEHPPSTAPHRAFSGHLPFSLRTIMLLHDCPFYVRMREHNRKAENTKQYSWE